jgi:hypothetical protein
MLFDTCSEISIGQKGILKNVRLVKDEVFIEGLGYQTFLPER